MYMIDKFAVGLDCIMPHRQQLYQNLKILRISST